MDSSQTFHHSRFALNNARLLRPIAWIQTGSLVLPRLVRRNCRALFRWLTDALGFCSGFEPRDRDCTESGDTSAGSTNGSLDDLQAVPDSILRLELFSADQGQRIHSDFSAAARCTHN